MPSSTTYAVMLTLAFVVLNNLYNSSSNLGDTNGGLSFTKSTQTKPVAESRLQRLARYSQRYNYKSPASYINHTERTELCGTGPDFKKYWTRSQRERSGDNEDHDIYDLFFKNDLDEFGNHIRGQGVVEMGAYDGIQQSNSRFFEVCLGWDALLVEGMPKTYEKLVFNRPNAHRFNYAPSCSEEDDVKNKTVAFDNYPMTNAGLSSIKTSYSVKNWTVDVACGSMTNVLLDIFPHGHVTFFSLDVEGAEPLIVGNIDFGRVFIEIMIVEHSNNFCHANNCESRDQFRKIMDDNGYIRFTRGVKKSDLFIHPLSRHLKSALNVDELKTEYERFVMNRDYGVNEIPKNAIW